MVAVSNVGAFNAARAAVPAEQTRYVPVVVENSAAKHKYSSPPTRLPMVCAEPLVASTHATSPAAGQSGGVTALGTQATLSSVAMV